MILCRAVHIDICKGYKNIVSKEVNEVLIKLQESGSKIVSVEQQGVSGRDVYVMIVYDGKIEQ